MGLYNHHKSVEKPPAVVPGSDMCGIVVAVGPSSNNTTDPYKSPAFALKEGDRVVSTFAQTHITGQVQGSDLANGLGLPLPGVLTQYRVFPTYGLLKVPDYLSFDEAAIITSSSDEKLQRAKKLGAKETINYRDTPAWDDEVLKLTSDRGADVVIEVGGAQTLRKSFEAVRFGGLIACIGYLSGKQDAEGDRTNTNLLCLKKNVTLKGIINGPRDEFERMLKFYAENQIHPVVDRVWKFEEADKALQYLFSGGHFGKVVIKVKQ